MPREVRTAHILVRVGETGGSEAEDRARIAVADAIRRAKAGEDFGACPRDLGGRGLEAERRGAGLGEEGEMVPPFDQA